LFGNVFLPVDISSFTLPEDYSEGEEEEDEDEEEDEEQPRTKKKRDLPEDHIINLDSEKEVLIHGAKGIFYGQGALYSLLGIEPGDTPILSSNRMRACHFTCHTTVYVRVTPNGSNNEELGDDVILAPHSSLCCIEVSKEEGLGYYGKEEEVFCEGYHGGDMGFSIWTEDQHPETRLGRGVRINVSIGDHHGGDAGPAFDLIPQGFERSSERLAFSIFVSEITNCRLKDL